MKDTIKNTHHFMLILIAMNVTIIISGSFLTPLWADFVTKIGGNLQTAGNAIGIFSIVIGVSTCLAAKLENRINQDELFLVAAQVFMAIGYYAYFFIHHPWQLYLVQAWLGIGGAFQAPAIYSLYHRHMPTDKSNSNWGAWIGFYNIAVGIGSFVSAYIAHRFSYVGVFSGLAIVATFGIGLSGIIALRMKSFQYTLTADAQQS